MKMLGNRQTISGVAATDAIRAGVAHEIIRYHRGPLHMRAAVVEKWKKCTAAEALASDPKTIRVKVATPRWDDGEIERINAAGRNLAESAYRGFCADFSPFYAPQDTAQGCARMGRSAGRLRAMIEIAREQGEPLLPSIIGARNYEEMSMLLLGLRWLGHEIHLNDARDARRVCPELAGKVRVQKPPLPGREEPGYADTLAFLVSVRDQELYA